MTNECTILIVDDHSVLSSGLTMLLNAEDDLEVVGQAADIEAALRLTESCRPGIILLDISLPQGSSLQYLPRLKNLSPDTKVIILTMHEDSSYLRKALALDADGYVLKKALDQDLLYAIRSVRRGEVYVQPSMVKSMLLNSDDKKDSKNKISQNAEEILWNSLSEREREVITGVAMGYKSKELAAKMFISEKTIATYRSRAMTKLDLSSKAELVELLFRLGVTPKALSQ